ncbi:MAG: 4-(cytidine 5'-diphospho)-2-C-methyl-D-erythritol kinase [Christensenellales bacterium]
MNTIRLKVFAKVNLALDVKDKRPDGYHNLDMLMASVDMYDTLIMSKSDQNLVTMDGVIVGEENTAVRALDRLTEAFGINMRVDILKDIPLKAGLGGSSADAAGVFVGAAHMFGIDIDKMTRLALKVGSDVPYMMKGGFCRVRGKGEIVEPVELDDMNMVILQAEYGASTAQVYNQYDLLGGNSGDVDRVLKEIKNSGRGFFNNLQDAAIRLCPSIEYSVGALQTYTDRVFMTGSGSAVVGVFDDERQARWCELNFGGYLCAKAVRTKKSGYEIF